LLIKPFNCTSATRPDVPSAKKCVGGAKTACPKQARATNQDLDGIQGKTTLKLNLR